MQKLATDVRDTDFSFETDDPDENYSALTKTFSLIVEMHAPIKKNRVRENHASFITKDLNLLNKFIKNPSEMNEKLYKRQRNKCLSVNKKLIKQYFSNITSKAIVTNREFWKTMKPFLASMGCLENSHIMLRDDKRLAKLFNPLSANE